MTLTWHDITAPVLAPAGAGLVWATPRGRRRPASVVSLQATAGLVAGIAALSTIRRIVQPRSEQPADTQRRDDRELVGGRR